MVTTKDQYLFPPLFFPKKKGEYIPTPFFPKEKRGTPYLQVLAVLFDIIWYYINSTVTVTVSI